VLQLRCPFCDAPIETRAADAQEAIRCARCGRSFAAEHEPQPAPSDANHFVHPHGWTVHAPAFPGRRVIQLVQKLAKRPSRSPRAERPRADVSPKALKPFMRWLSSSEWRTIGFAAIVFLGVPAAVIFFLVVVCAPHGR
jgi:hypothetical protein